MSVMILGTAHANLLATASAHYGVIPPEQAADLSRTLLDVNIDAFLLAYWDGPATFEDWDDLEDDEKDTELVQIHTLRTQHHYTPTPPEQLTADEVRQAVQRWQYQVAITDDHDDVPGWRTMTRLLDVLPTT